MGTISPRGSLPQTSTPAEENVVLKEDAAIAERDLISDTLTSRESIDQERYPKLIRQTSAYLTGSRVKVDYYRTIFTQQGNQATETDVSVSTSSNHEAFELIRNMILILNGEFAFEYDNETATSKETGECTILPGVEPHLGDYFIHPMIGGQMGVFKLDGLTRLSMSSGTAFNATFHLVDYASARPLLAKIHSQVAKVLYFDESAFLSSDGSVILTSDSYKQMSELRALRKILIDNYFRMFFSSSVNTLMRKDGVYDPYVVEYFLRTVSLTESRVRPYQLLPDPPRMDESLWGRFMETYNNSLMGVAKTARQVMYQQSMWSTSASPLVDNVFVYVESENEPIQGSFTYVLQDRIEDYVFSEDFYASRATMTPFEELAHKAIHKQVVDVPALLAYMKTIFQKSDKMEIFYHVPVCLYLITVANRMLTQSRVSGPY